MRTKYDVEIGDKVVSYDFQHSDECYCEGTVFGISDFQGCPRYEIQVEKQVWLGKEVKINSEMIYPPVNGTISIFGPTEGVELI